MAIEIIDGFKVSSAVPVDNRIVASGSTARNAIAYKYNGLRVYDTYDGVPYVWNNNAWKKESEFSLSVPSSITLGYGSTSTYKVGQILKVLDNNKQLTNSNMFELNWLNTSGSITNRVIAINHIDGAGNNTTNTVSTTAKLDVKGSIKATSFEGSGANITDISPLNFNTSSNKIKINQIEPGTNGYVLSTVLDPGNSSSSILQWINLNQAIAPSSITTSPETVSSNPHYLTFVSSNGAAPLYTNFSSVTNLIGVIPSTNQIVVKNTSSPLSPPYSFISEQNTGIYRSAAGSLAISILGTKKIEVDTNGLKVNSGNAANPGISFIGANNYGFYQTTVTNHNRIGVVVNSAEVMRIKSTGGQGNGNTTLFGEGGVLSLVGNTHTYIEFYRQGSATPDAPSVATPVASGRSAWVGYPSAGDQNFYVSNQTESTYLVLRSTGVVGINSKVNSSHGVVIENTGTNPFGVWIKSTGGDSLKITGGTNTNLVTLFSGTTRTGWMGHFTVAGGDKQLTIASDNTSTIFPSGGTNRPFVGIAYTSSGNLSTNSGYDGGRVGILVGGTKIMEVNRGGVAMWTEYGWISNEFNNISASSYNYPAGQILYFSSLNSNNNQTSTATSGFLAAEPFDRFINVVHSGSGVAQCFIDVEWGVNDTSGDPVPAGLGGGKAYMNRVAISSASIYGSYCSALIPKGRRFRVGYRISAKPGSGDTGYITIFSLMANYSGTS